MSKSWVGKLFSRGGKDNSKPDIFEPDNRTLQELQKDIYRRENDILKLNAEQNKGKITEKEQKITVDKIALELRSEKLKGVINNLATLIASSSKNPKKEEQKKIELWTKELKASQKELNDHQILLEEHKKIQELTAEKLKQKEQKTAEKTELSYKQKKETTFKIVQDLLKDQDGLHQIIAPLAEPRKTAKGISTSQKFKTGMQAVGYAFSHASTVTSALGSASFYADEAVKIQALIAGKEQYDSSNPPFFIRLLQDPDTLNILKSNTPVLNGLIKQLSPLLTDIVLKELGAIDKLKKEFDEKKKEIDKLTQLETELNGLKEAEKKEQSKIDQLQEKIDNLKSIKASYERAVLLQKLQAVGVDRQYINDKLLPIVQELMELVLEKPETLVKVLRLSADMILTENPEEKQKEILDAIDITILTKGPILSEFLGKEGEKVAQAADLIIQSNPELKKTLDDFKVTDQLLKEGIPLISELAGKILKDSEGVTTLYETIKPVILDDTDDRIQKATTLQELDTLDKAKTQMLIGVTAKLPDILLQDDIISVIKEKLPKFLLEHKGVLAELAETVLPKVLDKMKTDAKALAKKCDDGLDKEKVYEIVVVPIVPILDGVDPKFYSQVVPFAIDLINNSMRALKEEEIKAINHSLKIVIDEKAKTEDKDKAQEEIIKIVTRLLENKETQEVIAINLPILLKEHEKAVRVIANNIVNGPALKQYILQKEFVDTTTSLVVELASTGLAQIPKLMETRNAITEYTTSTPEEGKKEILQKIIFDVQQVIQNITPVLEQAFPEYLKENQDYLFALTGKITAQDGVKDKLVEYGIDDVLVMEMAGIAIDAVPQLLPIVTRLANGVLKDEKGIGVVVTKVQDLMDALDTEKKADTQKGKEAAQKDIDAKGTAVANSILDFIENQNNPGVKEVIEKDIPKFLQDNAKPIGETLDKFLNTTVIGRNLQIEGQKVIETISKKVPGLVDIAKNYQKGNYLSVMGGVVNLLRDKDVRHLVTRVAVEGIRYTARKSYTSYRTRRNKFNEHLNTITQGLEEFLRQSAEAKTASQGQKKDLGELLYKLVEDRKLGDKQSKTLEYMLIDKDLRGIVFDKANPIPLENIVIKGFSFDRAAFKGKSFAGSEITNCSFKGAKLEGPISFDSATIDAKSLKTLLPTIRKYNEKHHDNPITLNNVKIVGDISTVYFKDIIMENPDFSGATVNNTKTLLQHLDGAVIKGEAIYPVKDKAKQIGGDIASHLTDVRGRTKSSVSDEAQKRRSSSSIQSIP